MEHVYFLQAGGVQKLQDKLGKDSELGLSFSLRAI